MDGISIIMFVLPFIIALITTILSYGELKSRKFDIGSFFVMLVASISWSIFGLTWPAVATNDMFLSVAYLWFAFSIIFAVLTFYSGLRMLGAIFEEKTAPRLKLKVEDDD